MYTTCRSSDIIEMAILVDMAILVEMALFVEMAISVAIAILGAVVGVQRVMNGTVQWLSVLRNVGEGSSLYFCRGTVCRILPFPVSMSFADTQGRSSRISPQPLRFFPSLISVCTWWFGISCSLFMSLVVYFLPTLAIVVISLVLRLLEGQGRMVTIFSMKWVQLSQW